MDQKVRGVAVLAIAAVGQHDVGPELLDAIHQLAGQHHGVVLGREEGFARPDRGIDVAQERQAASAEGAHGVDQFLLARGAQPGAVGDRRLAELTALAARQADHVDVDAAPRQQRERAAHEDRLVIGMCYEAKKS